MNLLLITNYHALSGKYGQHLETILARAADLIGTDLSRNITSALVYVDIPSAAGIPGVTDPADPRQNKDAIDALYRMYQPDYIVLLGSGDIIPFQPLNDPVPPLIPGEESSILSDLPYACDAPFSAEITDFLTPVRKVTRLCDVQGPLTQDGLETFIRTLYYAGHIAPGPACRYKDWWNVCTARRTSAMYAMKNYFHYLGINFHIGICPPCGTGWDKDAFSPMIHHHILHGLKGRNVLYGEASGAVPDYPIAVSGKELIDQPREGMVLLENACYGGQLYHPADMEQMPLANIYLASGGTVFASSAVTYSLPGGMYYSDYLMSYFITSVLEGNDIGTALLKARQRLLSTAGTLSNPVLLKTLAEFDAYAHAAVRPVSAAAPAGDAEAVRAGNAGQPGAEKPAPPRTEVRLSKDRPPKHIQKYIADFLFSKGIRYDAASPPMIWRCTAESISDGGPAYAERTKVCTYVATVISKTGETTVYTFTEQGGLVISIEECIAN